MALCSVDRINLTATTKDIQNTRQFSFTTSVNFRGCLQSLQACNPFAKTPNSITLLPSFQCILSETSSGINAFSVTLGYNLNPCNCFTSSSRFLNRAAETNFPPFPFFIAVTLADIFVYIHRASLTMTCA